MINVGMYLKKLYEKHLKNLKVLILLSFFDILPLVVSRNFSKGGILYVK